MTGKALIDLLKESAPELGSEFEYPDLFGKYGHTESGISQGWIWHDNALKEVTELEVWKMIAISEKYWREVYERRYERESGR